MTLIEATDASQVKIVSFCVGRNAANKLYQLSLSPGVAVKVLRHAPIGGPIMIEVDGRAIALGRKIASHIMVEVIE
ncbi:MAG: FeoA family protein [Anaerolineaceae bacterium]